MATQQQVLVSVTVDGRSLGIFDASGGGDVSATVTKKRSGGMGPIKTYGVQPDYDDATVTRTYERERDHELIRRLRTRSGKAPMTISEQPLDENGSPWGRPTLIIGKLGSVATDGSDSESTDVRNFTLTCIVESVA